MQEAPGAWLEAVRMHPPYSDYYLFLSLANDTFGEKFSLKQAYENRLSQFFANRGDGFYDNNNEITFKKATSFLIKKHKEHI